MGSVYGVAIRKGGQGKSTTVSTLARLCALYGARTLVVDLAQPGTTTALLRDIWPDAEHADDHGALASALVSFRHLGPGAAPALDQAGAALAAVKLPVRLISQPSWSGGYIAILPWDEAQADAAAYLQSERVLAGLLASLAEQTDITLIDYPAEGGPLLTNALFATDRIVMPLTPETPALEGAHAMLRLMSRARASGHAIELLGILMTRCEPKNKRVSEIAQAISQLGEVEGETLNRKLFPFAIRANEFYEQAFRYGEAVWERSANASHWSGYVLLAEALLRDAGLGALTANRRGPALLAPDTRVLDVTALMLSDPELKLLDFEAAHVSLSRA